MISALVLPLAAGTVTPKFSLSNDGRTASLENRWLRVRTAGLSIKITTANKTGYVIVTNIRTVAKQSAVKTITDTDKVKCIEIQSESFSLKKAFGSKYVFRVRLTLRADSPALEIVSSLKNLAKHPVNGYYFWKISPARTDYFYSKGKFVVDTPGKLGVEDWAYFPGDGKSSGFGLILNTNLPGIYLYTIYPRSIWKRLGWYICRQAKVQPGNHNGIDFQFVGTESLEQFKKIYKQNKK